MEDKKLKNIGKIVLISITLMVSISVVAFANSLVPGSEQDPVVTLSYVKAQIEELKAYVDSKTIGPGGQGEAVTADTIPTYEIVNLKSRQKLIGKESTEIILRSGEAEAIDNGVNGISDLTEGKDLLSGDVVNLNHLLIVPRDDGRGIRALTEIYLMVKGEYEIQ